MFWLIVESETVNTNLRELLNVGFWIGHVHVAVEMSVREVLSKPFNDRWTDGQVWHEVSE